MNNTEKNNVAFKDVLKLLTPVIGVFTLSVFTINHAMDSQDTPRVHNVEIINSPTAPSQNSSQ